MTVDKMFQWVVDFAGLHQTFDRETFESMHQTFLLPVMLNIAQSWKQPWWNLFPSFSCTCVHRDESECGQRNGLC